MGKRQRLFPKASLVQTPPKDFQNQSNLVLLPCPPHRIAPPWEPDHLPRTESMLSPKDQPSSTQLPLHSSHKSTSMPASLLWHKHQTTNTGQLPYLKHQGVMRPFLPKKHHSNTFGLTFPSPDFRTKATVEHETSSKQVVIPPLVPVHQSKTSTKLKHHHGATSGTGPLPKISPGHDYQGKQELPFLKHQLRPLASSNHWVAGAPPSVKQKSSKTMNELLAPSHSQTSSSSVPARESNKAVHRTSGRQLRIATALLGGLDLWPKDVVVESTSPKDHFNATDSEKTLDQLEPMVQAHPETLSLLKSSLSEKEQPILRHSETVILAVIFNNKSRDKPAPSSFNTFISRGTNTYLLWPQPGPNHQTRLSARPSPDFMPWSGMNRAKSVPSLPLKIWDHQTVVTWPDHIAEALPGPDYKVKDTFGPSPHPVHPVIPLPGRNQRVEIPQGLNDQAIDPLGLYNWFEVSRGPGHQESISMRHSNLPEAASSSKTPAVTVLSLLTEFTPSPGLLDKSSLIAGDHRSRDPFGFDQHIKTPIYPNTWLPPSIFSKQSAESIIGLDFQALLELDNQSTHELKPDSQVLSHPNPNDQAISPPIPDDQAEPTPDDKAQVILPPDSDHWVKMSLRPDDQVSHPPRTNKLAKVESKSTSTQDLPPIDLEDQIKQILPLFNPKESVTSSSGLRDQKDTPTGNGYHQAKGALTFDYQDEAQSRLQYQKPIVQNKEIPWRLKYIKPYTTEGGTLPAETVSAIINSIPEKKIKNDMCKQILLRRMKESPPQRPGQQMSLSYTVCLECASWIPNGCPHVDGMNHLYETELLAIPRPLPGSEEMGVKFVLQVPKKKPFSFFSMLFPEYEMCWPSRHSSDLPSSSNTEPCGCPRVTKLRPSSSSSETGSSECPKVSLFDLILGKDWQPSEKKSPRYQLSPIDETLMESEDDAKEKLRLLAKGFKSLLEKFERQMKNC